MNREREGGKGVTQEAQEYEMGPNPFNFLIDYNSWTSSLEIFFVQKQKKKGL